MTKKHFKAIAEILGKAKAKALKEMTNNTYECYKELQNDFITLLEQENERFNVSKFQTAINVKCGECIVNRK
jgi:hypothetical protein